MRKSWRVSFHTLAAETEVRAEEARGRTAREDVKLFGRDVVERGHVCLEVLREHLFRHMCEPFGELGAAATMHGRWEMERRRRRVKSTSRTRARAGLGRHRRGCDGVGVGSELVLFGGQGGVYGWGRGSRGWDAFREAAMFIIYYGERLT